jgi:predicted dienelactone hydrolase
MSTKNQDLRPATMSLSSSLRRLLPQLPRGYVHRRRAVRRLTNVFLIALVSVATAYFITSPTGGRGFAPPKSALQSIPSSTPARNSSASSAAASPSSASDASDGYNLAPGPHAVSEVSDLVLHDAKRSKDLHIRIFYPNDTGPYPVIVFSHGAGGSQDCCEALTRHWSTYGYVTIQPTHDDSALQRRNSGEESIRFIEAIRDALKKPALWESRPQDISFVLDSLSVLEHRVPGLVGIMDKDRIGVGGHSMGSYTAEAIAGALIDLPGHPGSNFADPRVRAVLALSPQGPGQFGLNDHSFDRISLPYLGMTGSLDSLGPKASPAWHKIPFERSQPGDKYHVFIEGANHSSFLTARTPSPNHAAQGEAILGYTNSAALAFWDGYLKNDIRAKQYLQSDTLEKSSHAAAKLSRR